MVISVFQYTGIHQFNIDATFNSEDSDNDMIIIYYFAIFIAEYTKTYTECITGKFPAQSQPGVFSNQSPSRFGFQPSCSNGESKH